MPRPTRGPYACTRTLNPARQPERGTLPGLRGEWTGRSKGDLSRPNPSTNLASVVKEEQFLRQALAAGALALFLTGSFGSAIAAPTATSPDVAEWTSHLIVVTKSENSAKKSEFRSFAGGVLARTSKIANQLTRSALKFLGVPYVFGGTTRSGFDCSGYVQHVFAMLGITLPRTADAQYDVGHRVVGGMRPGDLVFFQTYAPGPSHVGIYLGKGKFVHASASRGVMVSKLSDAYWANRFIGAKRFITAKHLIATR
jgi:cell wall-associated NlpC family hydrolase